MNPFIQSIEKLGSLKQISSAIIKNETPCVVTGVSPVHKAQMILSLCKNLDKKVLILTEDDATALKLSDDINTMAGEVISASYPTKDFNFTNIESTSREYEYRRLAVLSAVSEEKIRIVISGVEAAVQKTIPKEYLIKHTIHLKSGDEISTEKLASDLIACGYTRTEQVEGSSQFAIRGSIADIFPVQSSLPVRIEFWGDEIDSISYLDLESQRRTEALEEAEITPALEILFSSPEEEAEKIQKLAKSLRGKKAPVAKKKLLQDAEKVTDGIALTNNDKYINIAYEKPAVLFDYFDEENSFVVMSEYGNIQERYHGMIMQYNEDIKILLDTGDICRALSENCIEFNEFQNRALHFPLVFMDTFMHSHNDFEVRTLINVTAYQSALWSGEIKQLAEDLKGYISRKFSVIVMAGSEKTLPIIAHDLRELDIPCGIIDEKTVFEDGVVYLMTGSLSGGYEYPEIRRALITQAKAMSSKKKKKKKRRAGEEIRSLSDISKGDLVVHDKYGIGRFEGIEQMEFDGVIKDYITIKYAGTDVLHTPVTQLDLVSRYIGPRDDANVKLNKLTSNEWNKTRSRVKSAVKDMADELIKLYAKREQAKGFAFASDDDWQEEFENRFDYSETDDQLRAIDEIKADMQKPHPMDRLLCGDVGFGKTEVAFRAAFKCIMNSKQCAILAPTTVLAWQHYQTALKRFEYFPIKIELLSRFRTPKEQKVIIEKLNKGEIDLIIGTHRLVQKDVTFSDLGLVIIDEEQRFGVAHKEKFKEIFTGVDVLTLSATPIPRTLNMAMSGIRDMSVLEEPPQDRYPVQTYVVEHSMGVIVQAITRELRRGGQVYYIHNNIEDIRLCAANIQEQFPDARIGIAHGRVSEEDLSEVWRQLIDHEIDILVCTTLIETGVDVPNCNTLIIENADRFGLSQLYQLRGRVGRSNRRAFAYFTFKRGKVISEIASKRLAAIREFTQFGSGFRIALRDLEIRGAGSLLGGKQHGHMEAVGYDMYLQILSETIAEEMGEVPQIKPRECSIDIQIDAYISEKYINSTAQRIDMYKKIAVISSEEEGTDLIDELIDRYGDPPKSILGLVQVSAMRNTASSLGIVSILQKDEVIRFYAENIELEQIMELKAFYKGRMDIQNGAVKPYFAVKLAKKQKNLELMREVLSILSKYKKNDN